jgi:HEAT repeat protein
MSWKGSSRIVLRLALLGAALATEASGQTAAPPKTENAKVEQRAVTGSFAQTVDAWAKSAGRAQWLGYAVPAVSGDRQICCGDWHDGSCGPCRLEGSERGSNINLRGDKVKLEGPQSLVILLRTENGRIDRMRAVSEDCTIDAGGLQVTWLSDVNPAESVKYLEKFVTAQEFEEHGHDRLSRGALAAIAMTGDPSADQAISGLTALDKPEGMRRETAFWAGEARGAAGLALLKRMAKNDPSSEVRAQVTFALSVSRESGAVDEMIRMAHEDTSTHVRGQALFWLAQKAGKRAANTITGAIDNDPDTEVKKKAVFALSQMPKDEGVPKLIEVAQSNRNAEVRKQAMFWLGQSNDPRALEFFEKVLSK